MHFQHRVCAAVTWRWRGESFVSAEGEFLTFLALWEGCACKEVANFEHNFWPRLLIMGCCSLPCKANEVCDRAELPVNTLPLNYLCLCNWCFVTLIKPKSYSYFLNVTANPLSRLLFSFYFQVSVLFWENFASSLLVPVIFSKLEFFLLTRQTRCMPTSCGPILNIELLTVKISRSCF